MVYPAPKAKPRVQRDWGPGRCWGLRSLRCQPENWEPPSLPYNTHNNQERVDIGSQKEMKRLAKGSKRPGRGKDGGRGGIPGYKRGELDHGLHCRPAWPQRGLHRRAIHETCRFGQLRGSTAGPGRGKKGRKGRTSSRILKRPEQTYS